MKLDFEHYRVLTDDAGKPISLGRGGMGITYKAIDTVLGREVAIKVISCSELSGEEGQKRFLREATATARLHHRNIATIYHQGRVDDNFYYAMEFIEGVTVQQLIKKKGALPVADALDITRQVVQALSEAEKHGLVHRDIKPANIMLKTEADGQRVAKLIDFGLAKFVEPAHGDAELTQAGGFLGTAVTSSPEQCRGEELDTRSDIYSLGITLWIMLTGSTPYKDTNPIFLMVKHLRETPPFEQLAAFPAEIVDLIRHMLQKKREDRPTNCAALLRLLDTCIASIRPGASDDSPTIATKIVARTGAGRRRWPPVVAVALVIAAGAGVYGWKTLGKPRAATPVKAKPPAATPSAVTEPVTAVQPSRESAVPPTETATSIASSAYDKLNHIDLSGFLTDYLRLHDEFGDTAEGASELDRLNRLFNRSRQQNKDLFASWAQNEAWRLQNAAGKGMLAANMVLGEAYRASAPTRAVGFYQLAATDFRDRKDLSAELEALVRLSTVPGSPPDADSARRIHEIVELFQVGGTNHLAKEFDAVLPWMEELAKNGNDSAMMLLGKRLAETQPDEAAGWLQQAALRFDRDQQWQPAIENYLKVVTQFPKSEHARFAQSRIESVGEQLLKGEIKLTDEAFSALEPLLIEAGELPVTSVLEFLGVHDLTINPELALQRFTRAAEAGSASAMAQTGLMWQKGIGTEPNPSKAVAWFRKSAELENKLGCYFLALCLLDGIGAERKPPEAIKMLEISARLRYGPALDRLADCYRRGVGVEKDYARAMQLYDQAIAQENTESLGNKGVMLMNGEGVAKSETQAVKLFEDGALQGNPWCMYLYGVALWHGTGIAKDRTRADDFLKRAAGRGIEPARKFLLHVAPSG